MPARQPHTIIIGSGFGGLAAAGLLAHAGHKVTVLEKNEQAGGRASTWEQDGFTFDMGPSWYMMPEVFEDWFAACGASRADYYKLRRLDPHYRAYYQDGTQLEMTGDLQTDMHTFDAVEPGAGEQLKAYLSEAERKYDLALQDVLYKNADTPLDLLRLGLHKHLGSFPLSGSFHDRVAQSFKNEKLQHLLEFIMVFLGCSPRDVTSLYTLLSYADLGKGVWYPIGGFHRVVSAMREVAQAGGAQFQFSEPVTSLEVEHGRVVRVVTELQTYEADSVISNADYLHTLSLLPATVKRPSWVQQPERKQWSPSGFILYLGIRGALPELAHHTLLFSDSWDQHFSEVFELQRWPERPSLYISKRSDSDPSVAPAGHENLMVYVPVAAGLPESVQHKQEYRNFLVRYIEDWLGLELESRIVTERVFSVDDFSERYNSFGGNAFGGLANTLFQSSIFRPHNQYSGLSNLYFAGANTVPGIGVPTSVISGHLAYTRVTENDTKDS